MKEEHDKHAVTVIYRIPEMKPTGIDNNACAACKWVHYLIDRIVHLTFQDDDTLQLAMPMADGGFLGKIG